MDDVKLCDCLVPGCPDCWELADPEPVRTPNNMDAYRQGYRAGQEEIRPLLEQLSTAHLALLNACLAADANGELSECIDGSLLDASARAQEAAEKVLYPLAVHKGQKLPEEE